jgi:hypothetical protein
VAYCGAPTLGGGACRQIVGLDKGSGLCPFHDPARADELTAMRRKGAARANAQREPQPNDVPPPREPKSLGDVIQWHSWTATALARGQIDKGVAGALTYCLQQLRGALVSRDLEHEVEELRATVATLKQRRAS